MGRGTDGWTDGQSLLYSCFMQLKIPTIGEEVRGSISDDYKAPLSQTLTVCVSVKEETRIELQRDICQI